MGKEFIGQISSAAQSGYSKYGILASITIAQAILESSWGGSKLASTDNNLFGIKVPGIHCPSLTISTGSEATDDGGNYVHYDSIADSIEDHGYFLRNNSRYAAAIGLKDASAQIAAIAAAGYASASDYNGMVMQIVNENNLTQYDNGTYTDSSDNTNTASNSWKEGWNQDTTGWFYVTNVASKSYYKDTDGWKSIGDAWYIFKANGYAYQDEWYKDSSGSYYFLDDNCKLITNTWLLDESNNIWYRMDSNGKMTVSSWFTYKDKKYYLKTTGEMANKEWVKDSDKWYYCNEDGEMLTKQILDYNDKQYYLDDNGVMVTNTTVTVDNIKYTINSEGEVTNTDTTNITTE